MIRNPQIIFDGKAKKSYLFREYPGKYFVQNQKHQELRSNQLIFSPKSKTLKNKFSQPQQYKNLKAQAEYIKKIHEVKKRLQSQIKKCNQQRKNLQNIKKKVSFDLQTNSPLKLEQICVKIRRQRQIKSLQNLRLQNNHSFDFKKSKSKEKNSLKYLLKNKAWIRKQLKSTDFDLIKQHRKLLTEPSQQLDSQRHNYSIMIKSKLNRVSCIQKTQLHQRRNNYSEKKNEKQRVPAIRYLFPQKITNEGTSQQLFIAQNCLSGSQNCLSHRSLDKSQVKKMKLFKLQGQAKSIQKRMENKRKLLLEQHQFKQSQMFLKGWDYYQQKYLNDPDNINIQQLIF